MKRRLATSALVGIVTFVVVSIVFHFARFHSATHTHNNAMPGFAAPFYALLFGIINAAAFFAVGTVLKEPPAAN